ncbi:MAG: hypothetical protein KF817_11660 [Phycisphaeraceae bacterium]|nr:hypothetical protein [Phycisphaeraceae bacterium]
MTILWWDRDACRMPVDGVVDVAADDRGIDGHRGGMQDKAISLSTGGNKRLDYSGQLDQAQSEGGLSL